MTDTAADDTKAAKPDRPALPPSYDDEAAFIKEARERFQQGVDFDRENRDEAIEDLKFVTGEQWDPRVIAKRKGRPVLTINDLPQKIAQVTGDMRINKPSIKVRPAEDADEDLAEVREGLIRAIQNDSDAVGVYINAGQSQVACGIGNFRVALDFATDDGFNQDIVIKSIPNPFAVVWDPMAVERTGRDAAWCFVDEQVPRKEFEAAWKDEQASGLQVPMADVNGWSNADTVRVCEYWLIKEVPTEIVLLQGGQVVMAKDVGPADQVVRKRTVNRKTACMYLITGTTVLAGPYELPIDRVPIFRVQGWEFHVGDKRVRWGLVRFTKDSVRLKNLWRSVAAETMAQAPRGKWLVHEQAIVEDGEDDFRKAAKSDDPLLIWKGQNVPTWVNGPEPPAALLQEAALNSQDIKDVTGLHDASLGIASNETSGKAITARQREGDVANYVYHDNLTAAICECGRVTNELIPAVYDTARTIRVIGNDEAVKVQRINDPANPDSRDINQGKFDVIVETGPSYSTQRAEAADAMISFLQAVPQAGQIAGDLIAKAQDWPMSDEIAERLKRALPPQLTQDDNQQGQGGQPGQPGPQGQGQPPGQPPGPGAPPPGPPQPPPEVQQALAMQQQAAQIDLETKQAGLDKARADAAKAAADARLAELKVQTFVPPQAPQQQPVDQGA